MTTNVYVIISLVVASYLVLWVYAIWEALR